MGGAWHTSHQPSPPHPPSRPRAPARGKRAHPAQWARPPGTPGSTAGAPVESPGGHVCTREGEHARAGTRVAFGLQIPPDSTQGLLLDSSETPEQADVEQDCPLGQAQLFQRLQERRNRQTRRQLDQRGRGVSKSWGGGQRNSSGGLECRRHTPRPAHAHLHPRSDLSNTHG